MKRSPRACRPANHRNPLRLIALGAVAGCGSSDDDGDGESAKVKTEKQSGPQWSYHGATGPAKWGDLDPEWRECKTGKRQSPIDLTKPRRGSAPKLTLDYQSSDVTLINTGHSIEAEPHDAGGLELGGKRYELSQFHFHAPSEHHVDGRKYPLELHVVNEAEDGGAVPLGVLLKQGKENPAYTDLLAKLPQKKGDEEKLAEQVDPADLLPSEKSRGDTFRYDGSLTTPPCSEGMKWVVYAQPVELSADQIKAITDLYGDNVRPVQPLNGRKVIQTAAASGSE